MFQKHKIQLIEKDNYYQEREKKLQFENQKKEEELKRKLEEYTNKTKIEFPSKLILKVKKINKTSKFNLKKHIQRYFNLDLGKIPN